MAKFGVRNARDRLGFTPSTAVRANIDTRSGEQALGPKLVSGASAIKGQLDRKKQEERIKSARRLAIEEKNRKNLDDRSAFEAIQIRKQSLLDIEVMKASTSPEQWELESEKIVGESISSMQGLDFSEQESAKQQLINDGNLIGEPKKAFVAGSRKLKAQAQVAQTDQLVETIRAHGEGPEVSRQATEFIKSGKNNGVSPSEILLGVKAAKEAGLKLRNEDAVEAARNRASVNPEVVAQEMRVELDARKSGEGIIPESTLSNEDLLSTKKFADGVVTETKVRRRTEFDQATGTAVAGWTAAIADPSRQLTEAEVWNTPIAVGDEFQADLGQVRNTWAGIARGMADRGTRIQTGKDKAKREDAYDPALVSDLKNRAKDVIDSKSVAAIKQEAALALAGDKEKGLKSDRINDDDLEVINTNADKTFNTILDKDLSDKEAGFNSLMTRSFLPLNQAAWLQSQILAMRTSGRAIAPEDAQELLVTFNRVGEARRWATGQAADTVQATIDKASQKGPEPTLLSQRELQLTVQKNWLRKTDTQLVEEYKAWLKAKP
jgi:hypothetical protein